MKNIPTIIRGHLDGEEFLEKDIFGVFTNEVSNEGKTLTPGGLYGFFVRLSETEAKNLYAEANKKGCSALSTCEKFKPINNDIYPLYWGKDKSIGSRINGHIKNPDGPEQGKNGTGLIRLSAYAALHGKEIGVFTIVVNDNSGFETHIRKLYPDLLKTSMFKL